MKAKVFIGKTFIFGIIVLLCIPATLGFSTEKYSKASAGDDFGVNLTINGTMGNGGWYVSDVIITFYTDDNETVYYSFDSINFAEFLGIPIVIHHDGLYDLYYYYVNSEGWQSPVYGPIPFKIDQTRPIVDTWDFERTSIFHFKEIVEVSDVMSGIMKVDFYFKSAYVDTIFAPGPFELEFRDPFFFFKLGFWFNHGMYGKCPSILVYDVAGNNQVMLWYPF